MDRDANRAIKPRELLSVPDGIFLIVGMVIGVGIFKAPGLVAGNASSAGEFFFAWVLGGIASLCGALVYAELASRYPETGGEYSFLRRGWGEGAAFVFAWSRMTVIQTGAIAAVSFVFGEYMSQIYSLGPKSAAIWAALGVVALTLLNFAGTVQSKGLQKVMETLLVLALLAIAVGGIAVGGSGKPATGASTGSFALVMIFVLLYIRRLERRRLSRGRSARRAPQHGAGAGLGHRRGDLDLSPRQSGLLQRARPGRHEGIEGDRLRHHAAHRRRARRAASRAGGVRLGADHHERRDLHRRAHQLGARRAITP